MSASTFSITKIERQGDVSVVSFPTESGFYYKLQGSPSVTPASWTNLVDEVKGNGATQVLRDFSTAAQRFYRVLCKEFATPVPNYLVTEPVATEGVVL